MTGAAVEVRGLTFGYGGGPAVLRDVSFTVPPGQRVALIGPNGAGKSTLLWHLNGLLPDVQTPTPTVFIHGVAVLKANFARIRRQVGLLFQNPDDQLFCPTVGEDVAFGPSQARRPGPEVAAQVSATLRAVGLEGFEARRPGELSLGEKKRACLAGLLASEPLVLALDEPTSSLDPRARRAIVRLLERLAQTMVIATHDLALAREICHRVVVLDEGVVQADDRPSAVLDDLALLERHGLSA